MPALVMDHAVLRHAIERHAGNRGEIARSFNVSSNGLRRLIATHGLAPFADGLAAEAHRPGPQMHTPHEAMAIERDWILVAIAEGGSVEAAMATTGLPRATIYRRIWRYEITSDEVSTLRHTIGSASDLAR